MVHYEEGNYKAEITGQALVSNKKGNPELQLVIAPTTFEAPNGEQEPVRKTYPRTIYLTMTDATLGTESNPGWVFQTLQHLGFNRPSFSALDPADDNHQSFVGQTIEVSCKHDEYNGQNREKWSIYRTGATKTQGEPMEKKAIRQLDTKFSKLLKSTANDKSAPKSTEAGDNTPSSGDDQDIPF